MSGVLSIENNAPARRILFVKLMICLALGLGTLAVYAPVRHYDFVNYDDDDYIIQNAHVFDGLTAENVAWAFSRFYAGNWHPLTWLSHMLDVRCYGLNPGGHHVTNVVFHAANAILLFLVLTSMTGALWRSAFVAGVFALHPLHVESVAWISERKDVLSTLFFLLTLGAYALYAAETHPGQNDSPPEEAPSESAHSSKEEKRRPQRVRWRRFAFYILSLVLFAMGLLSKAMLVTTPFVLLLLDWWPLKRIGTAKADRYRQPMHVRMPAQPNDQGFSTLGISAEELPACCAPKQAASTPAVSRPKPA
jgi:hypothetical protein